jgi:hypothetical protein
MVLVGCASGSGLNSTGSQSEESIALDTAFFVALSQSLIQDFAKAPNLLHIDPIVIHSAETPVEEEFHRRITGMRQSVLRQLRVKDINASSLGPCANATLPAITPDMLRGCPDRRLEVVTIGLPQPPEKSSCSHMLMRFAKRGHWFIGVRQLGLSPSGSSYTHRTMVIALRRGNWKKVGEGCVVVT